MLKLVTYATFEDTVHKNDRLNIYMYKNTNSFMHWNLRIWCGYTGNKHNVCSVNSFKGFRVNRSGPVHSTFFSGTKGSCSQTEYLPQPLYYCIFIMRPETSQLARALLIGYLNYIISFANPCFSYNRGSKKKNILFYHMPRDSCYNVFLLAVKIL